MKEFNRFILVGLLNTFIGYSLFYIFLKLFNFSPAVSNLLSYILIIIFSYRIYKINVFTSSEDNNAVKLLYLFSFSVALSFNQVILYLFDMYTSISPEIYQIYAMVGYTLTFFYLNKRFVFRKV